MSFKELNWRPYRNEFRSDIRIKGLFGIRFTYGKNTYGGYYYQYIINGKRYCDYFGIACESLEEGKMKCEEKYNEICKSIMNLICDAE